MDNEYEDSRVHPAGTTTSSTSVLGLPSKSRPAFFSRSVKAAERAAIRTQVNESDSFLIIEDGMEHYDRTPTRVPGTFGHRDRGAGYGGGSGKANGDKEKIVYAKKISADLDSDDDLMMTMREKGFTDGQIADRLLKDGRARYDRKSISTRIGRIKLAQAAHVDFLLAEGYKEWEHVDDLRLMQAYELANIEVEYEIERVRAWRFKKVAEYMRRTDKDAIFSEKACRDRYQALLNGTAVIPIDEDDDPDARRMELEAFREERERVRALEIAEKAERQEKEKEMKEEAKMRHAQRAEQVALARERKQEEKAQRAMQRAAQNQMKLQRAQENKIAKMQRVEQIRAQKEAEKLAQERKIRELNKNEVMKLSGIADLRTVNASTPDPRGYMSVEDLKTLCGQRALKQEGKSKAEFVERLRDADDIWNLQQLKTMCRVKGLNTAGTKVQLQYQLAMGEARKFASFGEGLLATRAEQAREAAGGGGDQVGRAVGDPIDLIDVADDDEEDMD